MEQTLALFFIALIRPHVWAFQCPMSLWDVRVRAGRPLRRVHEPAENGIAVTTSGQLQWQQMISRPMPHCPGDQRPLVLASSSPRRQELLSRLGIEFTVDPSAAPEVVAPELPIDVVVSRLAFAKTRDVASQHRGALILAADTLVALDGAVFGKPVDAADARRMLGAISGRSHRVVSGIVALDASSMRHESRIVQTGVHFRALAEAEIEAYVQTGEPLDKAGAYGLQGLGAVFVERVDGDPYNVIGLPLVALNELLQGFGACILCRRPREARD